MPIGVVKVARVDLHPELLKSRERWQRKLLDRGRQLLPVQST